MLFPRFSLRLILGAVTALCCFFLVVSFAVQGRQWAIAVSIAGATAAVMAFMYAALFCAAWLLTVVFDRRRPPVESPFATDKLPPVLVTPRPDLEN